MYVCMYVCGLTSVRGAVEAYVKAFDRHFNMLLADVDEEYILNKVYLMLSLPISPSLALCWSIYLSIYLSSSVAKDKENEAGTFHQQRRHY